MSEKVAKKFAKVAKVAEKFAENIKNKFICEQCDYICFKKDSYTKHLGTSKHKNKLICEKVAKVAAGKVEKKYLCDCCNYLSCKKSDYIKHLNTVKHKKKNGLKSDVSVSDTTLDIIPKNNTHDLVDSSLNDIKLLTGLIVKLVKSNNDLQKQTTEIQKQMIDVCQKIQPGNNNNNNNNVINSHNNNKTFNLHLFLNEECKDAMNLSEFINSIQPKITDLENIGKVGYIEGVSDIISKKLNDTELNKRPVHCSDAKREILYIKEENKWEKDTDETKKMVKAVRDVNKKNYQLLANWKDMYPNCTDSNSIQSEEFTNIVGEVVMDNDELNVKKVIKKVTRHVVIDK